MFHLDTLGLIGVVIMAPILTLRKGLQSRYRDMDAAFEHFGDVMTVRLNVIEKLVATVQSPLAEAGHLEVAVGHALEAERTALENMVKNPGSYDAIALMETAEHILLCSTERLMNAVRVQAALHHCTVCRIETELTDHNEQLYQAVHDVNRAVFRYNRARKRFPGIYIASITGYREEASRLNFPPRNLDIEFY